MADNGIQDVINQRDVSARIGHRLIVGEPFEAHWEKVAVPDPGPGEVLVRTRKTLISTGTELTAYVGDFPSDSVWSRIIQYPWSEAGYSNVGDVVAAGRDVTGFPVGKRVVSWGRHASHNVLPLSRVPGGIALLPDDVTDDQAVFWQLGKTVMNGVRLAQIALGEAVVLVGMGLLGQLALQYAVLSGAHPVIAVDLSERRLMMAREHGATHTVVGTGDGTIEEIRRITRGRMADVVFEITGSPTVIPPIFRMARPLGRVVLLGSTRGSVAVDFHDQVHTLGLRIIGAHVSTQPVAETPYNPWTAVRNGELFFDLVLAGKLRVHDLITHRYEWQDAPRAYEMLAADRTQALGVTLEGWTA